MSGLTAPQIPALLDITLDEVVSGLDNGLFTSVQLTSAYLARIDEVNHIFRAVLEINKDALKIAESLDDELRVSGRRGPLHGVPLLVKDNIVTDDEMEASAGSFALLGAKPAGECSTVTKLRKAGAVILGKTNLSEWANFRTVNYSSGWSPRGGQTMGTYCPNSDPSGSSSGSAVATALGLCFATLGSETSGSIIFPAEVNNVVGLKPTSGLIAGDNCIPISYRQDVVGPIARTVKDVAIILDVMAGRSEKDKRTWNIPFDTMLSFTASCKDTNLSGIAVGLPRNAFSIVEPAVMVEFEAAVEKLRSLGADIVDNTNFDSVEEYKKIDTPTNNFVIASEFKSDLKAHLATLQHNPHNILSMSDLIDFTKMFSAEGYPDWGIEKFLWTEQDGADVGSEKYKVVREKEISMGGPRGIFGAMDRYNLDVLAVPANSEIPTSFAAKLGLPIISIPLGFYPKDTAIKMNVRGNLIKRAPGIPFSISFIGRAFSEPVLLKVAHAFEKATPVRANGPPPYIVPKTEIKEVHQRSGKI